MHPAVQKRTNVAGGRTPGATNPGYVVVDPACGTGGFLLAAHDYMAQHATSKKEQRHLKEHALRGNDIVDSVVRLCAMNLYLHSIGPNGDQTECPVTASDALAKEVGDDHDFGKDQSSHPWRNDSGFDNPQPGRPVRAFAALRLSTGQTVTAHPPFGKKSSITVINEKSGKKEQEKLVYEREDFWATTSNKQLTNLSGINLNSRLLAGPEGVSLRDETNSFVQHIANMLAVSGKGGSGKAAVVVPDNVLFEGGWV